MTRYVAFLRGVTPMNAKMPDLVRSFELAGFTKVRTILGSGNVAFDAQSATESALERKAQAAMRELMGREFYTIVRASPHLVELVAADPFSGHTLPPGAKRVVSFLRGRQAPKVELPLSQHGATVLCLRGREALSVYVAGHKGPVFMKPIDTAFGADVTTRTWDTVKKCASA